MFLYLIGTNTLSKLITFIIGDHGIHYGKYYNDIENTFPPLIIVYKINIE